MKKLLLLCLFACPLFGMQSNTKSLLQEHKESIKNAGLAAVLLNNSIIVGVANGGCSALGPVFVGGSLATIGAKKAYDYYKGSN